VSFESNGKTQGLPRDSRESGSLGVLKGIALDSRFHGNDADLLHVLKMKSFAYFREGH
jgi:hypothetical protein